MITVRALHDGIFAVSTINDDGEDDCPAPKQPSCRSCLCWITLKPYVCLDCEQTYCNVRCAATERHKLCTGRQTALAQLPSKESHAERMAAQLAYQRRQKALQPPRPPTYKQQWAKRWRANRALQTAVASLDRER